MSGPVSAKVEGIANWSKQQLAGATEREGQQQDDKVRENRLRRMARRQGLRLQKSRRRDPHAWDYGTYQLVSDDGGAVVAQAHETGRGFGLSLADVEAVLTDPGHKQSEWKGLMSPGG